MSKQYNSIGGLIRQLENYYINDNTLISKYVNFSQYETIERIDAYLNSRHISGEQDALGREKPFFNIVIAAVNIWYRATDIDRKDIRFVPQTQSAVVLAFVANVFLQKWMNDNNFGQFLNNWGRSLARYGSSSIKFIKNSKGLSITVTPWNRMISDPIDYDPNPKIEVLQLTEGQLRKRVQTHGYDEKAVDALCSAIQIRETIGKQNKDNRTGYIKIYELHADLPKFFLTHKPKDRDVYVQQMHVVSLVGNDGKDGKKDDFEEFNLVSGEEEREPNMITHLIKEDGRSLSIGAVEYLFNAQWMQNHTVKSIKDSLDLTSKVIFQTADSQFIGRNVLTEIEVGDIFIHKLNQPITRIANDNPSIVAQQNFGQMWQNLAQEITNTPDLTRGVSQAQPLTFGLGQILNNNSNSLFEIMTENKGLAIEEMMKRFIIPHIKTLLNHTDEVVGILDDAGVTEIDSLYIPKEAVRRHNKKATASILEGEIPQPFDQQMAEEDIRTSQGVLGNKRFFVPDEIGEKTWDELFSDFQWDNVHVEVTNENVDKSVILQTLSSVLQTIATNPAILQDPNAKAVFSAILNETGALSPIQLSSSRPVPAAPQVGGGGEAVEVPAATATQEK